MTSVDERTHSLSHKGDALGGRHSTSLNSCDVRTRRDGAAQFVSAIPSNQAWAPILQSVIDKRLHQPTVKIENPKLNDFCHFSRGFPTFLIYLSPPPC